MNTNHHESMQERHRRRLEEEPAPEYSPTPVGKGRLLIGLVVGVLLGIVLWLVFDAFWVLFVGIALGLMFGAAASTYRGNPASTTYLDGPLQ